MEVTLTWNKNSYTCFHCGKFFTMEKVGYEVAINKTSHSFCLECFITIILVQGLKYSYKSKGLDNMWPLME